MTNVTQEDREAAADILDVVSNLLDHVGIGQVADLIRDGEYDEHEVMPLVARHREQARAEAIEQAWDKARGTNADLCKTPLQTYRLMLDAIRSLSAAQEGNTKPGELK